MDRFFKKRKAIALITILVILMVVLFLSVAIFTYLKSDLYFNAQDNNEKKSFFYAQAGLNVGVEKIYQDFSTTYNISPLLIQNGDYLYNNYDKSNGITYYLIKESTGSLSFVKNPGSAKILATVTYSRKGHNLSYTSNKYGNYYADLYEITSTSIVNGKKTIVSRSFRFALVPSDIFQYSYFMNNFGWWSGFPKGMANMYGNTGSNGPYQVLSGNLNVKGNPSYWYNQSIRDGGGVYSGLDPVYNPNTGKYISFIGGSGNFLDYASPSIKEDGNLQDPDAAKALSDKNDPYDDLNDVAHWQEGSELKKSFIPLANMDLYEKVAKGETSLDPDSPPKVGTIKVWKKIGSKWQKVTLVDDGVLGDNEEENNLLIIGSSKDHPIEIDGLIVVQKDVVIKGYVKGNGVIYSGRNIYLAGDIKYVNSLTDRESELSSPSNDVQDYESFANDLKDWVEDNANADSLMLIAKKHVVSGPFYKCWWWNSYIKPWLYHTEYNPYVNKNVRVNDGHEDSGIDKVPISGDKSENDGKWTVAVKDQDTGQIYIGKFNISGNSINKNSTAYDLDGNVVKYYNPSTGQYETINIDLNNTSKWAVVPGSFEDTDGDGKYTPAYVKQDFQLSDENKNHWKGLIQGSVMSYIAKELKNPEKVDAFLYANNSISGFYGNWSNVNINGGWVAQQESTVSFVKWSSKVKFKHDDRFNWIGNSTFTSLIPREPKLEPEDDWRIKRGTE